jgi:TonB family protein
MKENSFAISASLLFHIIIVALFLRVPFDQYIKPKLMVLDFSIEKGQAVSGGEHIKTENRESRNAEREMKIENRKSVWVNPGESGKIANRAVESEETIVYRERNVQRNFAADASLAKQSNMDTVVSDPVGQVMVRGETGPMGTKNNSTSDKNVSVGVSSRNLTAVSGGIRVIDYGKDGSGTEDFPFVAETLNRRFKDRYPDRARRMEWEGEVRVSFVISEDGVVHNVEIIKSSGRSIFDNHAREILAKTTFDRRLPYPLKIENRRIIYKLQ